MEPPRGCRRLAAVVVLAALTVGCTGQAPTSRSGGPPSVGVHIPVPRPFRVIAGEGSVWVLSRGPRPCSPAQPCTVARIDPGTNRLIGTPTRLPADGWDLAVGAGSVWATQFDGRLVRIDARTGAIRARISARPIYFGSVATFGGGFVWTGNDDERNHSGSVSKIDPVTNRVVGNLPGLGSPQSIAFGQDAVWVADHTGWLVKIDPVKLKVVARRRLDFGPHGVVVAAHAVYVADAHGGRLLQVDPETAKVRRIVELSPGPHHARGWGRLDLAELGRGLAWHNPRRPRHAHRSPDPQDRAGPAAGRQRSLRRLRVCKRLGAGGHRIGGGAHTTWSSERATS
jgi:DNA-binding beta-propeller fold protein YncE